MTRFLVGVIVGATLGSATVVAAQQSLPPIHWWMSGANVSSISDDGRMGYAAGATDMLYAIIAVGEYAASANKALTLERMVQTWRKQADCFFDHEHGGLPQYAAWWQPAWLGSNDSAAVLMLLDRRCP